jgi:hypothetical protein
MAMRVAPGKFTSKVAWFHQQGLQIYFFSISTPHVMIYCAIPICGKVYFIPLKEQ